MPALCRCLAWIEPRLGRTDPTAFVNFDKTGNVVKLFVDVPSVHGRPTSVKGGLPKALKRRAGTEGAGRLSWENRPAEN